MCVNEQAFLKIMWFSAELECYYSLPWSKPHIPNKMNSLTDVFHMKSIYCIKFSLLCRVDLKYIHTSYLKMFLI